MGIGIAILLIVVGLILILNVVHLPHSFTQYVDANTLGIILLVVGVIGIVLVLIMNAQRQRTTRIERHEDPRV